MHNPKIAALFKATTEVRKGAPFGNDNAAKDHTGAAPETKYPDVPIPFSGWSVSPAARDALIKQFPATHPRVEVDHVTYGINDKATIPKSAKIVAVGMADRGGIQAMAVTVDGDTHAPDGRPYHITWSLEHDQQARNSSALLKDGYTKLPKPIVVRTTPFKHEPVSKANPYRDKGRFTSKDKATSVTTMEQDMTRQQQWLTDRAKELGHPDMDTLAHRDMTTFFELTKKWRRTHAFSKMESLLNLIVR